MTQPIFCLSAAARFEGLDKIIERRVDTRSMGFMAEITSKRETNVGELLRQVLPQDFIKYGMIPEFIGRVPVGFPWMSWTGQP